MKIDVINEPNEQEIDVHNTKAISVDYKEEDPTVPEWAKQPAKPTYTAAEIGAAPAGFGLGENAVAVGGLSAFDKAGVDAICVNGWCYYADENNKVVGAYSRGIVRTDTSGRTIYQTFYPYASLVTNLGLSLQRCIGDIIGSNETVKTWTPWEWVNPPMELGFEYRTTERFMGKPVYVVAMDLGTLPTSDDKDVYYPVSLKCENIVSYDVIISNPDRGTRTLPTFASDGSAMAYAWSLTAAIRITVLRDMSVYNGRAVIKYVKD